MADAVRAPRLRVATAGCESDPAVVFIHGLGASLETWSEQASRLSDRCYAVSYDLRSHGASEAVDEPCTRGDLARDLVALLDRLSLARATLVGHSGGGVVAMQTAVDHPQRVSALVLVGTASECNDRAAAWYADCALKGREEGGAAAMRTMGMDPEASPPPHGRGFAHTAMAMRTLNEDPLTERLASVGVPTLIVVGEKDFLGVGGSVILSRTIEGSELEIVPGRGHGVFLEDPDWFARRLERFLSEKVNR